MTWNLLCFLISIAGIALSFYKIDHENFQEFKSQFKKRKTITIVIFILAAFAAGVSDFYTKHQDANKDTALALSEKQVDSLSGASKALSKQLSDVREDLSRHDRNTKEILAKYGYQEDTVNNTLQKLVDKVTGEVLPTLTILELPSLTKINENKENVLMYKLSALHADAHLLDNRYIYIFYKNGNFIDSPVVINSNTINYTTIIPAGSEQLLSIFLDRSQRKSDTFAIAIEIWYKSKGNVILAPVRKIYQIEINNNKIREATSEFHYGISLMLKKHKIWRKFYKL